jgi:polar amino acid transport system substrate-binding protein
MSRPNPLEGICKSLRRLLVPVLMLLAPAASAETLRIGTEPDYAPYAFIDGNGELVGFDIDLGNALCAAGNFTCEWVPMPFDALVDAVAAGEIDMAIAGMAATPSRAERVDFSDPYRPNSGPNVGAFAAFQPGLRAEGVLTGVQSGTIYVEFLESIGQPYVLYPDTTAMIAALRAGEVQAIFGGGGNLEEYIERGEAGLRIVEYMEVPNYETAMAISRTKKGLLGTINTLLDGLRTEGVLDELEARWFPVGMVL